MRVPANDEPLHLMAGSFGIGNANNNTDLNSVLPRNNKTHTPIFELYPLGSSCLSMPSCSKEFILKHSKPKMSKTPHEPSQWEDGKSQVIGSLSKNLPLKMKLDTVWIKNLATVDPKMCFHSRHRLLPKKKNHIKELYVKAAEVPQPWKCCLVFVG